MLTVNGAAGIAAAGNHLYWANAFGTSIGRATIEADGTLSGVNQTFITGAREPAGIAVLGNEVFWTNANSTQPPKGSLSRATLAADGSVASVQHELLFDESGVFGVAIDAPVDVDPPVVTMSPVAPSSGSWFSVANSGTDGVRVDVSASDPSGVVALSCSADGATVLADTGGAPGSFTLRDGVHHVTCTATDGRRRANSGAGAGSTAFPVTLQIDQTPPSISCLAGPSDWVAIQRLLRLLGERRWRLGAGRSERCELPALDFGAGRDGRRERGDRHSRRQRRRREHRDVRCAPREGRPRAADDHLPGSGRPSCVQGGPGDAAGRDRHGLRLRPRIADGDGPDEHRSRRRPHHDRRRGGQGRQQVTVECAYRVVAPPAASKYVFKGLRNLHKRSFRYGSWVPLRFRLTDANGAPVPTRSPV